MKLVNAVFRWYIKQHLSRVKRYLEHPLETQDLWFKDLVKAGAKTLWGKEHQYSSIKSIEDFRKQVPLSTYENLQPYINRMMKGEKDVLWPGRVQWFSKSSGTTGGRSKFIPVPEVNLRECHLRGAHDVMATWYANNDAKIFEGKNMIMGGSYQPFEPYPSTKIGDVSAIMIEHMPAYAKFFNTPDVETALMPNYEEKINRMVEYASKEDVTTISGVPTWTLVLFQRILEHTGKQNMLEVWPNFEVFMHGGVNFGPYRQQFRELFPSEHVGYLNIYNASEGFFAAQLENTAEEEDMTLLLDNGVLYEFLPIEELEKEHPQAVGLEAVEVGRNYALVITTNAGLWRYIPGDTVKFTSTYPFRIKISGRTQYFINAFGEEVILENTDKAVSLTCGKTGVEIKDYTVAPIYLAKGQKGGHQWLIEFAKEPNNLEQFADMLDQQLQAINSDYEAKRFKNLALERLKIHKLPSNTFYNWLKSKGKIGGQYKVPRLSNNRTFVEEILDFVRE